MIDLFYDDSEKPKPKETIGIILEYSETPKIDLEIPSKNLNIDLKKEEPLKMNEVEIGKYKYRNTKKLF